MFDNPYGAPIGLVSSGYVSCDLVFSFMFVQRRANGNGGKNRGAGGKKVASIGEEAEGDEADHGGDG